MVGVYIHHVNVGFGDATIIQTVSDDNTVKSVLIDAGPESGRAKLSSYIKNNIGNQPIDLIIASHYHLDHIGGFQSGMFSFGQYIDIGFIDEYVPDYLKSSLSAAALNAYKTKVVNLINQDETKKVAANYKEFVKNNNRYSIKLGEYITLGKVSGKDVRLQLIAGNCCLKDKGYILKGCPHNLNDTSLCFILEYDAFTYYTGGDLSGNPDTCDLESPLAKALNRNVSMMKANHHGSRFNNNETFISVLKPQIAIFFPFMTFQLPRLECLNRFSKQLGKDKCDYYFTGRACDEFADIDKLMNDLAANVNTLTKVLTIDDLQNFKKMRQIYDAKSGDWLFELAEITPDICLRFIHLASQLDCYTSLAGTLKQIYNYCKYNLYIKKTDKENLLAWIVTVTPGQAKVTPVVSYRRKRVLEETSANMEVEEKDNSSMV